MRAGIWPARILRGLALPLTALEAQRGHLFPWVPVCLGVGIGLWFALPVEPGLRFYQLLGLGALVLVPLALRGPVALRPLAMALCLAAIGALVAGARAHMVAAPVLEYRFYGGVEGRIVNIDRSLSDRTRLTLDRVVMERLAPDETPARIRVSLHGRAAKDAPAVGSTIILTANISPPQGPVEPGAFDFRRLAWFAQLGGVGYTRTPVLMLEPAETGLAGLVIARLRHRISQGVQAAMPGEPGAFAAAVLTGDRSGIARETLDNLRNSNLAHLLAISGLHMALLTGFVFAALRYGLALIPPLALRIPVKKTAAVVALMAAGFYLALSGGAVATERAFVMVAVMLVAVLFDRRALSLRSVAMAAVIVLLIEPESLGEPGFQMSFAATTALVAAFQALRRPPGAPRRLPGWAAPAAGLLISSAVAGFSTAPYAAAHFNRIADYGLLANLLSVPIMGAIVMPAAVIAACLWPVGLSWLPLWAMEQGTRWILGVAAFVDDLPGSVRYAATPPETFLPLFTIGALFLILWQGRARLLGLAPMAAALALWAQAERPPLLIAGTGGIVGVLTDEGRAVTKPSGDGFAARSWLEDDGDGALQPDAFARAGFQGERGNLSVKLGQTEIVHLSGRGWRDRLVEECKANRIIVVATEVEASPGPCTLLDPRALSQTGALAGWLDKDGALRFETVVEHTGKRLWTGYRPSG